MRRKVIVFAMVTCSWAGLVIACEKTEDMGFDASTDGSTAYDRTTSDLFVPDIHVDPPIFESQVAQAYCARLKKCCGAYDGGTFDHDACLAATTMGGWAGFNAGLAVPGVKNGGHIAIDQGMAQACIAGLATLSCPSIGSAEIKNVTLACSKAIVGTQTTGGPCLASVECKATDFCSVDPDGGAKTCAPLLEAGAACGAQEQCSHLGGPNPPLFCATTCVGLRADDSTCASDHECQSGICFPTDAAPSCADAGCSCAQNLDFRYRTCGLPFPLSPNPDAGDASDAD